MTDEFEPSKPRNLTSFTAYIFTAKNLSEKFKSNFSLLFEKTAFKSL